MFLRIHKPPGLYHVTFSLQEFRDVPAVNMSVQVRGCVPGEVSPIPDTCEPCLPGSFSLNPSQPLCQVCPEGASCPGGAVILPLPGWWHSAADSAQLHRCDALHSKLLCNVTLLLQRRTASGCCLANTAHQWLNQLLNALVYVCAGSLLEHCIPTGDLLTTSVFDGCLPHNMCLALCLPHARSGVPMLTLAKVQGRCFMPVH
jgi:hypothetical protein